MTSEAIDESAVNVFILGFVLGSGTARRCLESSPTGANEPSGIGKLKPGRRTATVRFQDDLLYYSFTMSSAQCGSRPRLRIFGKCVREASLHGRGGLSADGDLRKDCAGPEAPRDPGCRQILLIHQRFLNANRRY
jgi:hypothetical protein